MQLAQPNFNILDTGMFQRNRDNALLRQIQVQQAQLAQQQAQREAMRFQAEQEARAIQQQQAERQRQQMEAFRSRLKQPQYAGMQEAPIGQEQADMMRPELEAFGPQGIQDAASYADKPVYKTDPLMEQLASAPDNILAQGMGKMYDAQFDRMFAKPEKPQLATVYDKNGNPRQKWLRPGESEGVDVGGGKPDKVGEIDIHRGNGLWQTFQTLPSGKPDWSSPLGPPFKKKPGASETSVNVSQKLETEENKAKGKFNVETLYKDAKTAADAARVNLNNLNTMERYTERTGWGAETAAKAANVLASLGVKDAAEMAGDQQMFASAANDAVLNKQLAQKGPQTESDARRMESVIANYGNTPEANKFIISVAKAQAKRDISYHRFLDTYWRSKGTYEGAEQEWYDGEGGKSIFESPELKKYGAKPRSNTPTLSPSEQAELDQLRKRFAK